MIYHAATPSPTAGGKEVRGLERSRGRRVKMYTLHYYSFDWRIFWGPAYISTAMRSRGVARRRPRSSVATPRQLRGCEHGTEASAVHSSLGSSAWGSARCHRGGIGSFRCVECLISLKAVQKVGQQEPFHLSQWEQNNRHTMMPLQTQN